MQLNLVESVTSRGVFHFGVIEGGSIVITILRCEDLGLALQGTTHFCHLNRNLCRKRGFARIRSYTAIKGGRGEMTGSEFFMSYVIWRMRRIATDCEDLRAVEHLRLLVEEIEDQAPEGPIADAKPKKTAGWGEAS